MPYLNQNGKIVEVTQAQFDAYTIQNNINPELTIAAQQLTQPAGGTVLNSNSVTTPILTPNTSSTSPNQALTQLYAQTSTPIPVTPTYTDTPGSLKVYGDATPVSSIVNPLASLAANETIVPASTSTTVPNSDSGFVETSPGVFQAAADLPVDPATDPTAGGAFVQQADGSFVAAADLAPTDINGAAYSPTEDPNVPQEVSAVTTSTGAGTATGTGTSADSAAASAGIQGQITNAQNQQTIAEQRKQINNGDWRVRLRLAPQANYLYRAKDPGILQPLAVTDGIIFPYTPQISTAYRATYSPYDLTHSNYRGYFYQNSFVDAINITATFTAQDTNDANYLLAVIHFLRSATKMFYGKDPERGSPPPVVYLSGLGDYQFKEHACVISQFQYNLPADVDYIRARSPNNGGLNFINRRDRQNVATNSIFGSINRLAAAFLTKGGIGTGLDSPPTLGLNSPTYVPTKLDITLTLMPIQSRQQVSQQFSLAGFASGDLLRKGFW